MASYCQHKQNKSYDIFQRAAPKKSKILFINEEIEIVNEYKYLGIL